MLVLSRHTNEAIIINDNIRVSIVAIENGRVRLGIEAPPEIRIHRQEIQNKIQGASAATPVPVTR